VPNRLSQLLHLLRSPVGRLQVRDGLYFRAWPLLWWFAWVYRRRRIGQTRLVAIVGSYGKTTTTRAVLAALGRDPKAGQLGNYASYLALALLRIRPGQHWGVVEIGINQPRQMATYARLLRPDLTVVTSIGSEHHNSLGSLETTRHEKAFMVRALPPSGLAILNGDDPNVRWMATQTRARVVTFGFGADNDVRASEVALDWPRGTRFLLHTAGETRQVRTRLLGRHQAYPILAAATVGISEGRGLDDMLPALEALCPMPSRMEIVELPNGAYLLRDEFKSGLETIDAALDLLAEVPAERKIVVLGEVAEPPGSPGPIYRRLGRRVGEVATRAVFVTHRRGARAYAGGAREKGMPRSALVHVGNDLHRAAREAARDLRPGDVVLVKGRDTQRLDRVALALMGRTVRCQLQTCHAKLVRCNACPVLELPYHE
jgi:UDP-N-acetylmuramoyl-tripeptide--D-alanyl-D-alanine ligase